MLNYNIDNEINFFNVCFENRKKKNNKNIKKTILYDFLIKKVV